MASTETERILIVGGGIGGLTAAIALQRAGFDVAVFERAGEMREVGAGITLFSNALRVLRALGVEGSILARAAPLEHGDILDPRGRVLVATPVGEVSRALGAPSVALARSALLAALAAEIPRDALALGRTCVGFEEDDDGVHARFEDGTLERGSLLVGADGIRSKVRAAIHGESAPRYAGYTCWRAIAPFPVRGLRAGYAFESWGPGRRFGAVRIDAERIYWFASETAPPDGCDRDVAREMRARFDGWHDPIAAIVAATDPRAILRNDIVDRPPIARGRSWGRGRVTLLGDAAHASTPNLGQGAALAIEDALVLARRLARHAVGAQALRAYEAERAPRARAIVERSRSLGWIAQRPRAVECAVRDTLMRWVPARWMRRSFEANLVFDAGGP